MLISIIGCSNNKSNLNCEKIYQISDDEICLPKIESLVECSELEIIKEALEQTNGKQNDIIGFYMPIENYSKLDTFLSLNYDDFFQVSFPNQFRDKKISRTTYQEFVEMMNNNFISENWKKVEDKMKKLELKEGVNKPVVIKNYKLNKNVNCIEMVVKIEGFEERIITIMSLIYLKRSLITTGYYKHYDGRKSIQESEKANEELVKKLINSN